MNKKELVEKLRKELPEFDWKDDGYWSDEDVYTHFACTRILFGECGNDERGAEVPPFVIDRMKDYVSNIGGNSEISSLVSGEGFIPEDIVDSEAYLDLITKSIGDWKKEHVDKLRKGTTLEDQLVLIHPDWSIEGFEKDFKVILDVCDEDDFYEKIGIMSTGEWNFGNDRLCNELSDNSGDCFAIWPYEEDEDEPFQEKYPKTYEELKKVYPNVDKITKIYATDFD